MLTALVLIAIAAIGLALTFAREDQEAPPMIVDEHMGSLHGVRFGDSEREVRELIGQETDDRDGFFPSGADYTGPPGIPSPKMDQGSRIPPRELHYDDAAYLVSRTAGVFSMATLERGARTRDGVGIGDELSLVRERYGRVKCGEAVAGESLLGGQPPTYPWCRALVGTTRVFFGEDPVESITLTRYDP